MSSINRKPIPHRPVISASPLVLGAMAVAFLMRVYTAYIFPEITADELVQLVSAKQFALGHGISLVSANPDDLANFVYEPLDKWPPGYAVVVGTLLKWGLPYFIAGFLPDVLGFAAFFLAWVLIFRALAPWVSPVTQGFFFLFVGVSYMPWRLLATTDLLSMGFCFLSFSLLFLLLPGRENTRSCLLAFLLALTAFLCSFFRFSYYPVSLLLPFLFALWAWLANRRMLRIALWSLSLTLLLMAGMQAFLYFMKQNIIYLQTHHPASDQVWFPQHLLKFNPILVNVLFPEYLVRAKVGAWGGLLFNSAVSILVVLVLFFFSKSCFQGSRPFSSLYQKLSPVRLFFVGMITLSGTIILFLVALSLAYSPILAGWTRDGLWTYVEETRYYALVLIFCLFVLWMAAAEKNINMPWRGRLLARVLLGGSLAFSVLMQGYYASRYSLTDGPANMRRYYGWSNDLPRFFERHQLNRSDIPVVFCVGTASSWTALLFALEGVAPLGVEAISGKKLSTSSSVRVVFAVEKGKQDQVTQKIKELVNRHEGRLLAEIQDMQTEMWEAIILPEK